jgi:thiol-disulfide isomerase/thioredoxin
LLFSVGCSDKKEKKTIPSKETTSCAGPKEINCSEKNESKIRKISTMLEGTSILKSDKDEMHGVMVDGNHFIINDVKKPIVLVNFFSTWCPPCRGQLPYFEDLQKKYRKDLFITGILVNDDINASELEKFCETYHLDYFISSDIENKYVTAKVIEVLKLDENFTLPLTVLYKNGEYFTHYEGVVPIEMVDHDIRAALEKN